MAERPRSRIDTRLLLALIGLLVLVSVLWNTWFIYPLRLLVVFFHELSHGLAAALTGGRIVQIQLVAQEGGVCVTQGGIRFIILSAGYLGSLLWGGAILLIAARTRRDREACIALGALLLIVAVLWVRPAISFGFGFALIIGLLLIAIGWKLSEGVCDFVLKLIGLTSILYVPLDIASDTLARSYLPSDARMLAEATGVPTVIWGGLWILLALAAGVYFLVLAARSTGPASAPSPRSGRSSGGRSRLGVK